MAVLLALLTGCEREEPQLPSSYAMECEKTSARERIIRCENHEAVCYIKSGDISCLRR
jgi:hypothetical protein